MRRIFSIILIIIFISSGISTITISDNGILTQKKILKFSELIIDEDVDYVTLELSGTNSELLKQARSISSKYDLPYSKIEIFHAVDNKSGRTYLIDHTKKPSDLSICKLYYFEDKDGEYYKYNHCE